MCDGCAPQVLREKAEGKNPDEFYQAMQRDHLHGADSRKSCVPRSHGISSTLPTRAAFMSSRYYRIMEQLGEDFG